MTDAKDKPWTMLRGVGRASRWYPHEAIEAVAIRYGSSPDGGLPWDLLDPADAAEWLPSLREGLQHLTVFVARIEAIAEQRDPVVCAACGSRFYPSRVDARTCSPRCRQRMHRHGQSRD